MEEGAGTGKLGVPFTFLHCGCSEQGSVSGTVQFRAVSVAPQDVTLT